MSDVVVSVENVSKKFCRSLKKGMLYTSTDVARDMIGMSSVGAKLRPGEFWVSRDLSFELKRGESLGLLGTNGAGKSTLLKMLNGIIRPDKGRIRMRGRVGALIEVGAGFHPMLSGRENIYINGAILGMSKREIDRKLESIMDFSGLDSAILDAPVKTYSSGMYVRLGFAVAIHCEPDILLVDEILSVGDGAFRVKCAQRIAEFLRNDGTLILVSHNLPTVRECCDRVLYLEGGTAQFLGDTMAGLQLYQKRLSEQTARVIHTKQNGGAATSPVSLVTCQVLGENAAGPVNELDHDEQFKIRLDVEAREDIRGAHLHLTFTGDDATTVCGWTSRTARPQGLDLPAGKHSLTIDLGTTTFVPGTYSVAAFLSEQQHLADFDEIIGPSFLVRTHPTVDSRFGSMMLKGNVHVA